MSNAYTAPAKYVFLDVVGFTHNRTVDAQSDVIRTLNGIVISSIESFDIPSENVILLPTGDGVCIGIINMEAHFDLHLRLALKVLSQLHEQNLITEQENRRFEVRIGLNSNVDNIVTDVNGSRNLAGSGINTAARIMNIADGGQILVSQAIYETLGVRDRYHNSFAKHRIKVKHGVELSVYQFVDEGIPTLNCELPSTISASLPPVPQMNKLVLAYMIICGQNRKFFKSFKVLIPESPVFVVTSWMLAKEFVAAFEDENEGKRDEALKMLENTRSDFQKRFSLYKKVDFSIVWEMSELCFPRLYPFRDYFEMRTGHWFLFLSDSGNQMLQNEFSALYDSFAEEPVSAPISTASQTELGPTAVEKDFEDA